MKTRLIALGQTVCLLVTEMADAEKVNWLVTNGALPKPVDTPIVLFSFK